MSSWVNSWITAVLMCFFVGLPSDAAVLMDLHLWKDRVAHVDCARLLSSETLPYNLHDWRRSSFQAT